MTRTQFRSPRICGYSSRGCCSFNSVSRGRKTNYIALAFSGESPGTSSLYRASQSSIRRRRLAKMRRAARAYSRASSLGSRFLVRYYTCSRGKKLRINISLSGDSETFASVPNRLLHKSPSLLLPPCRSSACVPPRPFARRG